MFTVEVQVVATLVQLNEVRRCEFVKALVQELEQDKHSIGIYQQLAQVNELVDAVGFEVLQHEDEKVTDNHGRNYSMAVILIDILR